MLEFITGVSEQVLASGHSVTFEVAGGLCIAKAYQTGGVK